jgi:hypothetical protein
MRPFDFSYILYFLFAAISIIGLALSGYLYEKKAGKEKPYTIPEPKIVYILGIWVLFYIIAFTIEWLGHLIGIWTWYDTDQIFIHAAVWWANILTVSILFLSALRPLVRYLILLGWVLLYEFLQEALIHWATHFPLLGNPYLMITIVMIAVCSTSFKGLEIVKKVKLLK